MIPGYGAVTQALLGTLLTWGLTAAGAGCVFFIRGKHVRDLSPYNFNEESTTNITTSTLLSKDLE